MHYYRMRNLIVTSLILFLSLLFSSTNSAAQIRLAWNPNAESDLAGYLVHYGTASRTYGAPINVGNATSYTLTGLTPDIRYYFAVTAYDTEYNESGFSNEVYGTVGDIPVNDPPTVPVTLQAENFATKTTGSPTADAYGIWTNGYIEDSVNFPVSGKYSFIVTAFGSVGAGLWPEMEIRIDQSTIDSVTVNSGTWGTYVIQGNIPAGIHKVAIAFTNDYYRSPEDRNLYVDSIFIGLSAQLP
jgi:hypothetical protein